LLACLLRLRFSSARFFSVWVCSFLLSVIAFCVLPCIAHQGRDFFCLTQQISPHLLASQALIGAS